jgi:hypothetical protein
MVSMIMKRKGLYSWLLAFYRENGEVQEFQWRR